MVSAADKRFNGVRLFNYPLNAFMAIKCTILRSISAGIAIWPVWCDYFNYTLLAVFILHLSIGTVFSFKKISTCDHSIRPCWTSHHIPSPTLSDGLYNSSTMASTESSSLSHFSHQPYVCSTPGQSYLPPQCHGICLLNPSTISNSPIRHPSL